jgi:chromosome segregation ATPase
VEFDNTDLSTTIASLNNLRDVMHKNNVETSELDAITRKLQSEYNNAKTGIEQYNAVLIQQGKVYDFATGKVRELLPEVAAAFNQTTDITEEQSDILNELGVTLDEVNAKFSESDADKFYEALANQDIDTARQLLEQYGSTVDESQDAISTFLSTADDLQSAYETLNKAAEEYNQTGYISAATLKKLAKLPPEFQAQLENLNGTMTVSNGALQDQFEISKKLAIIHAKTETETEALAYAQSYLADNVEQAGKDSKESAPKVNELAQAYTELGNATQEANKGIWKVRNALGDGTSERQAFEEALNDIYEKGEKRVKTLEGIELDYVSGSSDRASSHKDAWVEAFEEEQRKLKHSLEMNEITEYEYAYKNDGSCSDACRNNYFCICARCE